MASPQEVIERSIPHPADSTPESRRDASTRVMQALASNQYHFMRRRKPPTLRHDGECRGCGVNGCEGCGVETVYVDHGPAMMNALNRVADLENRLLRYEEALHRIADGGSPNPGELARAALA